MKENYAGTRHMPVLNIINVNDIYPEIKEPNKLYDTYNYGQFKILGISKFIKYSNGRLGYRLNIQFINTGNICDISLSCARGGQIKDRMQKGMIYGVGYLGNSSKKGNEREYKLFEGILSRCYSANNDSYDDYGEKNVVVDERWHCFENFLNDIKQLPNYDKWKASKDGEWCLDKDKNQFGCKNKIYSKDTCTFMTTTENVYLSKLEHASERNVSYIGVYQQTEGRYFCMYEAPNFKICQTFDSTEAAARVFDYYQFINHRQILNNIDMSLEEAQSHSVTYPHNKYNKMYSLVDNSKKRQMCRLI